jgi:hypothetical protein
MSLQKRRMSFVKSWHRFEQIRVFVRTRMLCKSKWYMMAFVCVFYESVELVAFLLIQLLLLTMLSACLTLQMQQSVDWVVNEKDSFIHFLFLISLTKIHSFSILDQFCCKRKLYDWDTNDHDRSSVFH